eukprot:6188515-Pleurochrysis_carterae.AAC.2
MARQSTVKQDASGELQFAIGTQLPCCSASPGAALKQPMKTWGFCCLLWTVCNRVLDAAQGSRSTDCSCSWDNCYDLNVPSASSLGGL